MTANEYDRRKPGASIRSLVVAKPREVHTMTIEALEGKRLEPLPYPEEPPALRHVSIRDLRTLYERAVTRDVAVGQDETRLLKAWHIWRMDVTHRRSLNQSRLRMLLGAYVYFAALEDPDMDPDAAFAAQALRDYLREVWGLTDPPRAKGQPLEDAIVAATEARTRPGALDPSDLRYANA